MDVGGRVMQDDSMEGIGRVESGTETEQLPREHPRRIMGDRPQLIFKRCLNLR